MPLRVVANWGYLVFVIDHFEYESQLILQPIMFSLVLFLFAFLIFILYALQRTLALLLNPLFLFNVVLRILWLVCWLLIHIFFRFLNGNNLFFLHRSIKDILIWWFRFLGNYRFHYLWILLRCFFFIMISLPVCFFSSFGLFAGAFVLPLIDLSIDGRSIIRLYRFGILTLTTLCPFFVVTDGGHWILLIDGIYNAGQLAFQSIFPPILLLRLILLVSLGFVSVLLLSSLLDLPLIFGPVCVFIIVEVLGGSAGRFEDFFGFCSGSGYFGGSWICWAWQFGLLFCLLLPFGSLLSVVASLQGGPLIIIVINTHNLY